jgi:hypothetical protein
MSEELRTELIQAVAAGLLNAWRAELKSVTVKDSRCVLEALDRSSWPGWLRVESYASLGFVISPQALSELMREIPSDARMYDPEIRDQVAAGRPPMPTYGGSDWPGVNNDSGTLSVDDPGDAYTAMLFSWDAGDQEFTEVGPLADNSTPGAGTYVVRLKSDADILGLPSSFVTIS